jgi:hypothetical protein
MRGVRRVVWLGVGLVAVLLAAFAYLDSRALAGEGVNTGDLGIYTVEMVSPHFRLDWRVGAAGGGRISSAHFRLASTIGQPAIGPVDSMHFSLRTGYWQSFGYHIYLPLILRG